MKIYNINLGQLITLWFFGLIASAISFFQIDGYGDELSYWLLSVGILGALVFYTFGWIGAWWKKRKK